jgi:hypothetical protein
MLLCLHNVTPKARRKICSISTDIDVSFLNLSLYYNVQGFWPTNRFRSSSGVGNEQAPPSAQRHISNENHWEQIPSKAVRPWHKDREIRANLKNQLYWQTICTISKVWTSFQPFAFLTQSTISQLAHHHGARRLIKIVNQSNFSCAWRKCKWVIDPNAWWARQQCRWGCLGIRRRKRHHTQNSTLEAPSHLWDWSSVCGPTPNDPVCNIIMHYSR